MTHVIMYHVEEESTKLKILWSQLTALSFNDESRSSDMNLIN